MSALALALALLIGLSLGLLGGGGSILAVPVLVYVAGLAPVTAVPVSLAAVGATSLVAAAVHAREGRVAPRAALLFGGAGALGAAAGARLTPHLPPPVLLLSFAVVMLAAGLRMVTVRRAGSPGRPRPARPLATAAAGLAVGVLTGLLGVGGGFLAVPALVLVAGLPMPQAVGTSLVVVALNALGGLLSHAGHASFPGREAALFAGASIAGALAGARLTGGISPDRLRRAFGAVVLLVGAAVGARNALVLLERAP